MSTIVDDPAGLRPRVLPWLVDRPRLERCFDDPRERQVTLVCAPPGAGKTTLVSCWADRNPKTRVAWLSIGRDHRRAGAFLDAVTTVIASASGSPLDPVGPTTEAAQRERLDRVLRAGSRPLTLVIDDVHELETRRAVDGLNRLVDAAPPWLHLVLISRADPPIRIGRLRVEDRFETVRNGDLAMTADEAVSLFARHGVAIRDEDAQLLWSRTEGWAAGLGLVAMALRSGADPHEFARDDAAIDAAVADFLLGEVLARLDADDTACLLRMSVVDGITPDLAVALADDQAAARRLVEFEREGVFLTSNDGEVYRFHALMAALLRARLRREDPELSRRVHGVAARWYVDHDLPVDATSHAVAAEDWPLVGSLIAERWLTELRAGDLDGHLDGIPREVLLTTPPLTAVAAAAAGAAGRRSDAARFMEALDRGAAAGSLQETHVRLVARLLHACANGDGPSGLDAAGALDGPDVDPGLAVFVRIRRAELLMGLGRLDEAASVLESIDHRAAPALGAEARACERLLAALSGRPSDALGAPESTSDSERARCIGLLAQSLARSSAGHAGQVPHLDAPSIAAVLTGSHAFARCLSVLQSQAPGRTWLDPNVAVDPLADRLLVALGVLEVYDHSGTRIALGGAGEAALVRARQAVEVGGARSAIGLIEPWLGEDADCHPRTRVEAAMLAAVAWDLVGAEADAARSLTEALERGGASGVLAPIFELAPLVRHRLARLAVESGPHQSLALALVESCREPDPPSVVEDLTAKELVVLRFLPTLMSNAEIAATLNVSVNTVKTHLKGLYRKLGVERRREAVLRGRQLGLLT